MNGGDLEKLQRRLGYTFSDPGLLTRALSHRSAGANNNERLEFLGDAILGFVIAEDLFKRFEKATEGQLSRLRALLVKQQTLAEIARELQLGENLILGIGELKSGGYLRDSILSDTLEAVIGAMYMEADIDTARHCVLNWFSERLSQLSLAQTLKDPKSRLQEYLQASGAALPRYEVLEVTGEAHAQYFIVTCKVDALPRVVRGEGNSRRQAEQQAAASALAELEASP